MRGFLGKRGRRDRPVVGIAIARRRGRLVALRCVSKENFEVLLDVEKQRPPDQGVVATLRTLLADLPADTLGAPLSIALSSHDLACADAWQHSGTANLASLPKILPLLCEARCAGEPLENLALDFISQGSAISAVAISHEILSEIRRAAEGFQLTLLTSIPAVLAQVVSNGDALSLNWGGEFFEIGRRDGVLEWRTYPKDDDEEEGVLKWRGHEIRRGAAAAFAAAIVEPDAVPNALLGASDAPRSFVRRHVEALRGLGVAAALFFLALGAYFHRAEQFSRAKLAAVERAERELWEKVLPSEPSQPGALLRTLKRRVLEAGGGSEESTFPSALAFWGEIAKCMPDPDPIGLALESLDLAPDGGRLTARLAPGREDPMKNAAFLEGKLSASPALAVRGDYEAREDHIHVRMRLDYRGAGR